MIAVATYVSSRLEITMLVLKRLPRTAEMLLHSEPGDAGDDDARRTRNQPGRSRMPPAVANGDGGDGAEHELALGADREQAGPVGDRQAEAHQDQRRGARRRCCCRPRLATNTPRTTSA